VEAEIEEASMSLGALVLGIINVGIVVTILLLVGACVLWFCSWVGFAVPDMVRKLYIAVVGLIALYMIVALLFGIPSLRVISGSFAIQDAAA